MDINVKEVLKFLFPEYQILQVIRKQGFYRSSRKTAKQQSKTDPVSFQGPPIPTASAGDSAAAEAAQAAAAPSAGAGISAASHTDSPRNRSREERKAPPKASRGAPFDTFEGALRNLRENWYAAEEDRKALCKSLERPFVRGYDYQHPKNTILLVGPDTESMEQGLYHALQVLCNRKIVAGHRVYILDMSDYSSDDPSLFISDLYQGLDPEITAVMFEHIEKAPDYVADIISQLINDGSYKLPKRFLENGDNLLDATGVMNANLISQLPAQGQYFLYTSNLPGEKVLSKMDSRLVNSLSDTIFLHPLPEKELRRLVNTLCQDLHRQCEDHIHIKLSWDATVTGTLANEFRNTQTRKVLEHFMEEEIYRPLTEMKLEDLLLDGDRAALSYRDGFLVTLPGGAAYRLADFSRRAGKAESFDLEKALSPIIGLNNVKQVIRQEYALLIANRKRRDAQLAVDTKESLHMVFAGNPGTGKTTMARVLADMFKAMGILKTGQLVEVSRSDLVAGYVGQTAPKTKEVFLKALGGVLFIDEAYSLTNGNDPFGQECVDTLVKLMEDYRGQVVVILAGYTKEMKTFMKSNSGLESRFPVFLEFPDYTKEELCQIGLLQIGQKGFHLDDAAKTTFWKAVADEKRKSSTNPGNGRMVRNLVEKIIRRQSIRIARDNITGSGLTTIIPSDITDAKPAKLFDLEEALAPITGLSTVKDFIRSLEARLRIEQQRKAAGLPVNTNQTLHMIFEGNPGTGKTMMARIIAKVFYEMHVIATDKLVETDRSGLVAGYVGQTALKTKEVIDSALDGVLFIDEAYALAEGGESDFGKEAINTLVKAMDDYRDRLVVILAGYHGHMEHFLTTNPGLRSRFTHIISFPDYTTEELMEIGENLYRKQGYQLTDSARLVLQSRIEAAKRAADFGNGRFVRNVFEQSLNRQALRLSRLAQPTREELMTVVAEDMEVG